MPIQIDPETGERVESGTPQIDPNTGERMSAAAPQQPGFWENLGHTVGIGSQEAADRAAHPIRTIAMGLPGVAPLVGAYQGGKRMAGEVAQAMNAGQHGNGAGVASHLISAIPLVGPALDKMSAEAPPTQPGQTYAQQVRAAATPGNVGTALGTAAQVAPMVLGAADYAAPGRAMIPNPPIPNPLKVAKNVMAGPPEVQLTKALQPNKNNVTWNADVKPGMAQIKATEAEMGKPITGFDDAALTTTRTLQNIWKQVDAFQKQTGRLGATIDGNKIADAMVNSVDERMALQNPGVVDRIKAMADTYRKPLDVAKAEDFIQSNNTELTGYYAKNKVNRQAAMADPETAAKIAEGDALRDALYSKIDDLSGPGVAQLKKAYGAVRNIQKNLVTQQMVYARKAPASLGEQLSYFDAAGKALTGNIPGAIKDVAVRRFLSDLNDKNSMIQRAFEGTTPAEPFSMPRATPPISGLLPARAGGPHVLEYQPEMSAGERVAALMQYLREQPQPALPAKASSIQLPSSF